MELLGSSQSTFGDMVSELGLSAAMRPKAEYTLFAPLNSAFTSKSPKISVHLVPFSLCAVIDQSLIYFERLVL